jgi:hypothetical protein
MQPKSGSGKVVKHIVVEHRVEQPVFTDNKKSKFKTLQDWIYNICDDDKPAKEIAEYKFNFFESAGEYMLFLTGVNTFEEGQNRSITRIEFEPTNMYFKLRKNEYKNFNREQLKDKLTSQLKDFTNTEKFRNSFLAKANAIITGYDGKKAAQNNVTHKTANSDACIVRQKSLS